MAKGSIEAKIRVNAVLIYLLVALVCGGVFFYFYISSKEIDSKKKTVEEYNEELTQISDLINAVNEAQADVNLFVITQNRKHLRQYQQQTKEINLKIDSLKANEQDLGADTILSEITQLLRQKENSIILLNRQFSNRSPLDSLSQKITALSAVQQAIQDTVATEIPFTEEQEPVISENVPQKKGLWKKITSIFSSSKPKETEIEPIQAETIIPPITATDTAVTMRDDTLEINQIVQQVRINYDRHISAIENQINSIVMADQFITTRITELLTALYKKMVHSRIEDLNQSEELLRTNNLRALIAGGIALLLILIFIILILRNVNKGYSARKALERANERTRQLMESRHKLLLSVSHDVKTPLNSILGYIDIYQRDKLLTANQVKPIYNSGNHILSLLSNLLEFSSLEKGSVSLASRDFLLRDLCNELCEMFVPLARKKSLTFDFQGDFEPDIVLFGDSLRIKQILTNILSNAVKYTVEQGITFKATYNSGELEFRVIDTGVGIPADKQQMLFKPFSRVEENNILDEGSGLGLYVVKGLVDLFNGKIGFHTEQGKGTRVVITLPVPRGKKTPVNTSARKILIVDDDEVFLNMLSRFCMQLGHSVTLCNDRNKFMEELKDISKYDCVLTDMEMMNFTGRDVLKMIREQNPEIPVILITGRADCTLEKILSEGFTNCLSKPITLQALHALIGGKMQEDQPNDLTGFLGEDKEAVTEIMEGFFMATVNHIILLKEAVRNQDFEKAQYLCHKMLPMFLQTGAPESITATLKHIDSLRGENKPDDKVWEKINILTEQIELFLQVIQEEYLSD